MTHTKIFKQEDGDQIQVKASLFVSISSDAFMWAEQVYLQKEDGALSTPVLPDNYPEQILETKLELWQRLKPE